MIYKKIIVTIICTIILNNIVAKESGISKIKQIFSEYQKVKKTIVMLGDVNFNKITDVDNTQKQIRKFRGLKIDDRNKDIIKMKKKLDITLEVIYILKCESLINIKFLKGEISYPKINYPVSVSYLKNTSNRVVDPKCLEDPKILKDYNKAIEDYEQKKKIYLWNIKLKNMISFHKKLLFFPLRFGSTEVATSRVPLIVACIHNEDKQKEWLVQILKILKQNKNIMTKKSAVLEIKRILSQFPKTGNIVYSSKNGIKN